MVASQVHDEFKRGRSSFGCESKRNLSTRCPLERALYTHIHTDRTQLQLTAVPGSYETNYRTVLISRMFRVVHAKLLINLTTHDILFKQW